MLPAIISQREQMFCHVLMERSRLRTWEKEGELRLFSRWDRKKRNNKSGKEWTAFGKKARRKERSVAEAGVSAQHERWRERAAASPGDLMQALDKSGVIIRQVHLKYNKSCTNRMKQPLFMWRHITPCDLQVFFCFCINIKEAVWSLFWS